MIITIDGPAGAGKSTVAHKLAHRLGFMFLDTGAMYRAVTVAALRRGVSLDDAEGWTQVAGEIRIELDDRRVRLDGEDVSDAVRSSETTAHVRYAANNPGVRAQLVELQRAAAGNRDLVTEGRDQGTIVFPQAALKIYLTAGPEERARRRHAELERRGETTTLDEVLAKQNSRDLSDRSREVGPLVAGDDAVEVVTDGLSPDEVVDRLEALARERMQG